MSGLLLQLLRGKAQFKHFIAAPVYNDFHTANKNLPPLDEFLRGAKQAFVYVNQSLVKDEQIHHMQPCFTTALWQDIMKLGIGVCGLDFVLCLYYHVLGSWSIDGSLTISVEHGFAVVAALI